MRVSASEFDANYGMLSLHGLRKPAWQAHVQLQQLASGRVAVTGGDPLTGAIATVGDARAATLVYAYPAAVDSQPETAECELLLPAGHREVTLYRIGAQENNGVADWRALGAPASPTRSELDALRDRNTLRPAPADACEVRDGRARFRIERPGTALLVSR